MSAARIWADDDSRWTLWSVISHARVHLKLDIYPCIQTAFAKLHYYFAKSSDSVYPMWMLIVAAIASSSKTFDNARSFSDVFRSVLACARDVKQSKDNVNQMIELSDLTDRRLTDDELKRTHLCEMDIMSAHDYSSRIYLACDFFHEKIEPHLAEMPNFKEIDNLFCKYQCAILCFRQYTMLNLDLVACLAILSVLERYHVPDEVQAIADEVISKADKKAEPVRKLIGVVARMFPPK